MAFGAVGFVATIPTLRRLRRRTGWRVPALALVAFAAIFTFSTLVIGPRLSSTDTAAPATDVPASDVDHHGHDVTGNGGS